MLGWYLAGRNICIAMEYLPEGDLHSYMRDRSALAEEDSRQIISQVLQGLAIMHKVGIAHRDVKPQVGTHMFKQIWQTNLGPEHLDQPTPDTNRTRLVVGQVGRFWDQQAD
jgi:hypothetical protein